jgi:hypothetical protein
MTTKTDDVARLEKAEAALVGLTDECAGGCHWHGNWDEVGWCACRERYWPAIEEVRRRLREMNE